MHYVTPLLYVSPDAESRPVDEVVDQILLGVTSYVTTEERAVEVLCALGLDQRIAEHHVHYCMTGEWLALSV